MDDKQLLLDRTKFFGSQGYLLILEREKTIILLVQLFVSLLAIATFSEKIIPQASLPAVKVLIIILLTFIPILVWDYILKINEGISSIISAISVKQEKEKWYLVPYKLSVYFYIFVFTVIVDVLCKVIINDNLLFIFSCSLQMLTIFALFVYYLKLMNKKNKILLVLIFLLAISSVITEFVLVRVVNKQKRTNINTQKNFEHTGQLSMVEQSPDVSEQNKEKGGLDFKPSEGFDAAENISVKDWITYKNEKYGFEVKYPRQTAYATGDFTDNEEGKISSVISNTYAEKPNLADSISIGWGPSSFFDIDLLSNPQNLSFLKFIEKSVYIENENCDLTFKEITLNGENIILSGRSAYRFAIDKCCLRDYKLVEGQQEFIYFVYDKNIIGRISYNLSNPLDIYASERKNVFRKMVTTFKFLDNNVID